jgi:hypothetical protein
VEVCVSFDLAIWKDQDPGMTAVRAREYYEELCARPFTSFVPGAEVSALVDAVTAHFSSVSEGIETRPWAVQPDVGDDVALMPFVFSLAKDALPFVLQIAHDHGYACYDPQTSRLYRPSRPSAARFALELYDGTSIDDPDPELVAKSVRAISRDHWYVILDRGGNRYIQLGYGEEAGVPPGQYALEYRDGSPERHWRAVTPDLDACTRAFVEYRNADTAWQERFTWRPLS